MKQFIDFVEMYRPWAGRKIRVISHNFKGYDANFVIKELLKRKKNVQPTLGGQKILNIVYDSHISFIDSLNFLPMALSKFNSAFGLDPNVYECKGYSPYSFNTKANWTYEGTIPAIEYFDVTRFTEREKQKFMDWHGSLVNDNYVFNQRNELIKYCVQDVRLLQAGCLRFMKDILDLTQVNPFLQCITLAQTVLTIFRKNFMKPDSLGICQKSNQNQSFIGHLWLLYQKKYFNSNIKLEVRLQPSNICVDGYCDLTRTCYEFNGCWYHAHTCLKAFQPGVFKTFSFPTNFNLNERHEATKYKLKRLQQMNYKVVTEYECLFNKFLKANPTIDAELRAMPEIVYDAINCRDAVYGGRVESYFLYYKAKKNEVIRCVDYCSLYPSVMSDMSFCVGNVTRVSRGMDCPKDIGALNGLFKGRILPPQNLLIPLLPLRLNKKLFFPLCATCALNTQITLCEHTDFERSLYGTWCLIEIKRALELGYVILETTEIWEYNVEQYSRETKSGGLFTDYMKCFLKIKQESSGYPEHVVSDSEKKNYIAQFAADNDIQLDPEKIMVNASYRSLSKLLVNSLW